MYLGNITIVWRKVNIVYEFASLVCTYNIIFMHEFPGDVRL